MYTEYIDEMNQLKKAVQSQKPLIHHITNFVTIYECARITSYLGASPVMAFSHHEVEEVTEKADALVINTGTLNDEFTHSIELSIKTANQWGKPVIFDPVGTNLSAYRYDFIHHILNSCQLTVLRCNASELLNLYNHSSHGTGIDSTITSDLIPTAAGSLARRYGCTIVCTGATDYLSDGRTTIPIELGSPLLPMLVGTGCMLNSLIGSYLPVAASPLAAARAGVLTMNLAGQAAEAAMYKETDLGTFQTLLFDNIRPPFSNML